MLETEYLTLTIFDLKKSIISLSKIFKTICFRPVRGKEYGFNDFVEKQWEKEYDSLTLFLEECIDKGNDKIFKCLMNGEDFFGRYLCKVFGGFRTLNRCDAGISRFSCDLDGNIYPCSAASSDKSFSLSGNLKEDSRKNLLLQVNRCWNCPFKKMCGGECLIEIFYNNGVNEIMCNFKKHLILLSAYLELTCWKINKNLYANLQDFSISKQKRYQKDPELYYFLNNHKDLDFVSAKKLFDKENKKY